MNSMTLVRKAILQRLDKRVPYSLVGKEVGHVELLTELGDDGLKFIDKRRIVGGEKPGKLSQHHALLLRRPRVIADEHVIRYGSQREAVDDALELVVQNGEVLHVQKQCRWETRRGVRL